MIGSMRGRAGKEGGGISQLDLGADGASYVPFASLLNTRLKGFHSDDGIASNERSTKRRRLRCGGMSHHHDGAFGRLRT